MLTFLACDCQLFNLRLNLRGSDNRARQRSGQNTIVGIVVKRLADLPDGGVIRSESTKHPYPNSFEDLFPNNEVLYLDPESKYRASPDAGFVPDAEVRIGWNRVRYQRSGREHQSFPTVIGRVYHSASACCRMRLSCFLSENNPSHHLRKVSASIATMRRFQYIGGAGKPAGQCQPELVNVEPGQEIEVPPNADGPGYLHMNLIK